MHCRRLFSGAHIFRRPWAVLTTQKLRRANIFLISDFLSEEPRFTARVSAASQSDLLLSSDSFSDERHLNAEDPTIFIDEETHAEVLTEPEAIRNAYEQSIKQWLKETASVFGHHDSLSPSTLR